MLTHTHINRTSIQTITDRFVLRGKQITMMSMRAAQKLMGKSSLSGMTNQYRRAQVSVFTTPALSLRQQQYHVSSRLMSSSATSVEPAGVDLSLDQLRTSIAGGDYIRLLKKDNEYLDVVQYTHKNVIYNTSHIDYHSEAIAIGITENGLIPGDVVLTFLPPHLCETVRIITRPLLAIQTAIDA